jgi:hypothetical protein
VSEFTVNGLRLPLCSLAPPIGRKHHVLGLSDVASRLVRRSQRSRVEYPDLSGEVGGLSESKRRGEVWSLHDGAKSGVPARSRSLPAFHI